MSMTLKERWERGKQASKALESAKKGDGIAHELGEDWEISPAYVRQHARLFRKFDSYEAMITEITKEFGTVEVSFRKVLNNLVIDGHEYSGEETYVYIMEFSKSYKLGISKNVEERKEALLKNNNGLKDFVRTVKKYSFPNRKKAKNAEGRCKKALSCMGYLKNINESKEICRKNVDVIWIIDRCIETHRTQRELEREAEGEFTLEPVNE